jgi:hypothetical protein
MEDRHAAGYAEFHLARKVRLPFAVCLAVEYGELIAPLKGVQRHAPATLVAVTGHSGEYGFFSLFT